MIISSHSKYYKYITLSCQVLYIQLMASLVVSS